MTFIKTAKQAEAVRVLGGDASDILLYGGSRSGKSAILCFAIVARAAKEKSRHVILRRHFNHVKQSIWYDTMPKVMELAFPELFPQCDWNKSDWFIKLPNGSEIWIGGLDDKERTDKILGKEYSTIWFNECSEVSWESRNIAKTRLAERNNLKKKCYYDENPPKPSHWSCKYFIDHVDPVTEKPIDFARLASLRMNPKDNAENIDPEYIPNILENLPFILRKRFLDGEFWSDDSDIFQPAWITPGLTGEYHMVVQACDPAISERDSADESAICTLGIKPDGMIEEIETIHGHWGADALIKNLRAAELRHKPSYAGVETVAFQRAIAQIIKRDYPTTKWQSLDDMNIKSDVDKVRRAISISHLLERGFVRVNTPELVKQLLEFEGGDEKNDLVDAFIFALKIYLNHWRPPAQEQPEFRGYDNATWQRLRVEKFQEKQRRAARARAKGAYRDPTLGGKW